MSKNVIKESIEKGFSFILFPKIDLLPVLLGYFVVLLVFNIFFGHWSYSYAHLSPGSYTTMAFYKDTLRTFISELFVLPLVVYSVQKAILKKPGRGYFSYFLQKELWSLLWVRILLFICVAIPTFIVLWGEHIAFTHTTGQEPALIGLAFSLKMLTYLLILTATLWVFFYFLMRLLPLNIHVCLGKPVEMGTIFRATEGKAWAMFVSILVTGLPFIILWILTARTPMTAHLDHKMISEIMIMDVFLETVLTTFTVYLMLAVVAALSHFYEHFLNQGNSAEGA